MAIHIGQYASFDTGQLHCYILLNRLNRENVALFLSKAGHAFLIIAALHWFRLPVPQQSKIIPRKRCKEKM